MKNVVEPVEIHPIVRQIINRDCHVSESDRQVIRHVVSRLRGGWKTFRQLSRDDRRQLMRQCVRQHRKNRELYVWVMWPDYRTVSEEESNGS